MSNDFHNTTHVESRSRAELRNFIIQSSTLLEISLSGLVLIGLLISIVPLIQWMPGLFIDGNDVEIRTFLERALDIVIGHESAFENLLSVAAIALIFVVRKFFFVPAFGAHLPDGHPAPDLSPNQSGIPASEFKERLRKRLHAEDVVPETEEDDFVDAAEADEFLPEST